MKSLTKRKLTLLLATFLSIGMGASKAKTLTICVDDNNWIPFTYLENGKHKGIHIETISKALDELSLDYQFYSVPWKRCLKGLQKGRYDAVATASYKEDRAEYLWYPSDAAQAKQSQWRVSQVEYVISLPASSDYSYQGDPKTIPQPVRVPRGYSIGDDLKNLGVTVDSSAAHDLQNIKRMLRAQSGSAITLPSIVNELNQSQEFKGQLKFDPTSLKSKSYFFAIAKNGQSSLEQAQEIWECIVKARESLEINSSPVIGPSLNQNSNNENNALIGPNKSE